MDNTLLIDELRNLSGKTSDCMSKQYYLLLMSLLEAEKFDKEVKKRIISVMIALTTNHEISQRRGF